VTRQADASAKKAQSRLERQRRQWLANARAVARHLAHRNGTVTIDEVRRYCAPPEDIDPRVMGAVFRSLDFEATGNYRKSDRRECHNRPVAVFRLVEAKPG
jgi:menaquinone-dependent protoporphyrinogen IX oxidase